MSDIFLSDIGVAIVAPGGYAADEAILRHAVESFQAHGCRVHDYYQPADKFQRFGGTDQARLLQLEQATANPDVQVVIAVRGGYGMSRLLPKLDFRQMAASGKLFVGQSDFTAFHMGMLQAGAISFAGPMICDDFGRLDRSEFTMRHLVDCLNGPSHTIAVQAPGNPALDAAGPLWGGNLAMLTHLIGTPYLPAIDGGILFIEDVGEHPYRIERMLLQLHHSGILSRQKALLFGDFSNYRLSDYDNGYDLEAMLAYLRATLQVPILTGLPFGHTRDKVTLAVGSAAQLVSDGHSWELTMRNYPTLATTAR